MLGEDIAVSDDWSSAYRNQNHYHYCAVVVPSCKELITDVTLKSSRTVVGFHVPFEMPEALESPFASRTKQPRRLCGALDNGTV